MINNNKFTRAPETPQAVVIPGQRSRRSFDEVMDIIIIGAVILLLATIVCAFIAIFDFGVAFDWKKFTLNSAIVALAAASVCILLRSYAKRKGRRTKEWQDACKAEQSAIDEVGRNNLYSRVVEYCFDWEHKRLHEDRRAALDTSGIGLKEFEEKYSLYDARKKFIFFGKSELEERFPQLTKLQLKAIKRAGKIRRRRYDPAYLTGRYKAAHRQLSPSEHISTQTMDRLYNIRVVLTNVLAGMLSVALFSDLYFNLSVHNLISCLVKLIFVIISGVFGLMSGYNFALRSEAGEMHNRAVEINKFLKWAQVASKKDAAENSAAVSAIDRFQTSEQIGV